MLLPLPARDELNATKLASLQEQAQADGRGCVVGGLIVDDAGRIFVQKRSLNRKLFPGGWDIAGGHVELGETLYQTLGREIHEETGWQLTRIIDVVAIFNWESEAAGQSVRMREFDFLVSVEGDLEHPQIELEKFTEFRWVSPTDVEILMEGRPADEVIMFQLVQMAFQRLGERDRRDSN